MNESSTGTNRASASDFRTGSSPFRSKNRRWTWAPSTGLSSLSIRPRLNRFSPTASVLLATMGKTSPTPNVTTVGNSSEGCEDPPQAAPAAAEAPNPPAIAPPSHDPRIAFTSTDVPQHPRYTRLPRGATVWQNQEPL